MSSGPTALQKMRDKSDQSSPVTTLTSVSVPSQDTAPSSSMSTALLPALSRLSLSYTRPSIISSASTDKMAPVSAHDPSSSQASIKDPVQIDTSAILYPTFETHPEPLPFPILVLSLTDVTAVPSSITDAQLFEALLNRLDPWVGEPGQGGYVLVILAAVSDDDDPADGTARTWPSLAWWTWMLKTMPRKYRKNLKRLYIVHPSLYTRTLLSLLLPLLSIKTYPKLHPLATLSSLHTDHQVSLANMAIPLSVLMEEGRVQRDRQESQMGRRRTNRNSWVSAFTTVATQALSRNAFSSHLSPTKGKGVWSRKLDDLVKDAGGNVPRIIVRLGDSIRTHCTTTEGIFRRSVNAEYMYALESLLGLPMAAQPSIPWDKLAVDQPLLPPRLLLKVLRELSTPVIPATLYPVIRASPTVESIRKDFITSLPASSRLVLDHVVRLLHDLCAYESSTSMGPLAYAIVLAPALVKIEATQQDANLFFPPGTSFPGSTANSKEEGTLVGLLKIWIEEYDKFQ